MDRKLQKLSQAARDVRDNEIRRRFFKEHATGAELRAEFKCSNTLLYRVLGQSPGRRGLKPEDSYTD
jgi:hypothetical protein